MYTTALRLTFLFCPLPSIRASTLHALALLTLSTCLANLCLTYAHSLASYTHSMLLPY
jgi:hypothetical protein